MDNLAKQQAGEETATVHIPLGEVELLEELGRGGFGIVYKAGLHRIQKTFAIKLLDPSPFQHDPEVTRQRFFREAEILFKLRHDYIVPIYGVGEHNGKPYILMEYFDGINLVQARERTGNAPPMIVLPFIHRIGQALSYAHNQGVVHRDIKPSNLMTKPGDARVLDFGVARVLDPNSTRLTETGGGVFGDAFGAPELAENPNEVKPTVDIYSLGACWYWLLTGRVPKGLDWESALRKSSTVTPAYESVVLKCLAREDARYQSMNELGVDIARLWTPGQVPTFADDLQDRDIQVLGSIGTSEMSSSQPQGLYALEKEVTVVMTRLQMGLSLRRLERLGYITKVENMGEYG